MSERTAGRTVSTAGVGFPGPVVSAVLFAALVSMFWLVGGYAPGEIPHYTHSSRQVIGMALMETLIPPYIVLAAWLGQRRSLGLIEQTRPLLADPSAADAATEAIRTALRRSWLPSVVVGFVLSLFNTQPLDVLRSNVPLLQGALSAGQVAIWVTVGLLAGIRFRSSQAFRRLGEVVPIDLLRPDRLRPIARSGLGDILIIAGALLFVPLQSIDADFRWVNYRFGLLVALPSAAFFLLWPLVPLHRRNVADRDARLAEVERQLGELAGAAAPTDVEASIRLEALLAHRDRLRGARAWPLSTALLSRVFLYLVIPPLAWAGAAVVERFVDRLLGG